MKKISFVLLALLPFIAKAQFDQWLPGYAMTDSTHQNRNAFLLGQYYDNILFWDQQLDANTTQLCYKSVNPNFVGDQQVAMYQPNVKLTNPIAIELGSGIMPSEYLLIYQTNEGNDIDLKLIIRQPNGSFTSPVSVSALPGDDVKLSTDGNSLIAWENNGKIWVSQYLFQANSFTTPFAVDSAGANNPTFTAGALCYLKPNGDSTSLILVNPNYSQNNWIINQISSQSILGEGSALSSAGQFSGGNFAMQNKIGSNPSGLVITSSWNHDLIFLNSPNFNYSQPAIHEMLIIIKSPDLYTSFLAFVSDSLNQNEIFAAAPSYEGLQNISLFPGDDKNPKIFATYPTWNSVAVNLFWESERDGFSTIYGTHYDYLFGGIAKNSKSEKIKISPSPFHLETTISYQATAFSPVTVFDLQGRKIKTITSAEENQGWQNVIWDGTNAAGSAVAPGIYVVVAKTGTGIQSRIVIKK